MKDVSFDQINRVIAHKMSHLLAPAIDATGVNNHMGERIFMIYYSDLATWV